MSTTVMERVEGALFGMMLGDSMGMPAELWPRAVVREYFGRIVDFADGPQTNEAACMYKAGQYTDDSSQAFILLDAILTCKKIPTTKYLADELLKWAHKTNAFALNVLGPSSKAAIEIYKNGGSDASAVTDKALTNGAAMRIAPAGFFYGPDELKSRADLVYKLSKVTHSTDCTVGGAAMVAQCVAAGIAGWDWDTLIESAYSIYDIASAASTPTFSANCKERTKNIINIIKNFDEEAASLSIYEVCGTGTLASEAVPAALASAFYCKEPEKAALFCANMGGDTDTIGSMATAICGAKTGKNAIRKAWRDKLENVNSVNIGNYAERIRALRAFF